MTVHKTGRKLEVSGIVQGVGFRPFVYRLARRLNLTGRVANTAEGVLIIVEGVSADIDAFSRRLQEESPPLAQIAGVRTSDQPAEGLADFTIVKSKTAARRTAFISPDVAVCQDCLDEMLDPADRRYRYPFINCTNCGPRYTIIGGIPYDRITTSMRHFTMCPRCQAEYDDPADRRFHAQPNACPDCGPRVALHDRHGRPLPAPDPVQQAAEQLQQGHILAVKGLGGFHLAVDAVNGEAVARLRRRKHREEKPLALMSPDLERIARYACIGDKERELLTSMARPIVLLEKRSPSVLADQVSPANRYFGVMLPYTPLHHLLLGCGFTALVMTSGNLSEEPIVRGNQEAFLRLAGIADFFLVHDREIYQRCDDSIAAVAGGQVRLLRRSRGYVPAPVFFGQAAPPILACGAELKNTVCLTRGRTAFLSQHVGDLANATADAFFRETIDHLKRILDIEPRIVACDRHPDYLSSRYARALEGVEGLEIQHHHAHIAACLAENGYTGPVIGLAFDGTGYGDDGTAWGGEVLLADLKDSRRLAHLRPVPLPGGDAAVRQPWRMALSHLTQAWGEGLTGLRLPILDKLSPEQIRIVCRMAARGINAPLTSSLGRLFDAVAALCGIKREAAFEGQAAMELEMAAERTDRCYPFGWDQGGDCVIHTEGIIRGVVHDLIGGLAVPEISGRFHATLVRLFTDLCAQLARQTGTRTVALSGGVFQNRLLLEGLSRSLEAAGLTVLSHRQVPTNDGGIALGQAAVAAARFG
jgi:hydrogenase maturation protein HypF